MTGKITVATIALSALLLAACEAPQPGPPASSSAGNSMGMPGPSTGGPGLTPYSGGTPPQTQQGTTQR